MLFGLWSQRSQPLLSAASARLRQLCRGCCSNFVQKGECCQARTFVSMHTCSFIGCSVQFDRWSILLFITQHLKPFPVMMRDHWYPSETCSFRAFLKDFPCMGPTGVVPQVRGHGWDEAGLAQELLEDCGKRWAVLGSAICRRGVSTGAAARAGWVYVARQNLVKNRKQSFTKTMFVFQVSLNRLTSVRQFAGLQA